MSAGIRGISTIIAGVIVAAFIIAVVVPLLISALTSSTTFASRLASVIQNRVRASLLLVNVTYDGTVEAYYVEYVDGQLRVSDRPVTAHRYVVSNPTSLPQELSVIVVRDTSGRLWLVRPDPPYYIGEGGEVRLYPINGSGQPPVLLAIAPLEGSVVHQPGKLVLQPGSKLEILVANGGLVIVSAPQSAAVKPYIPPSLPETGQPQGTAEGAKGIIADYVTFQQIATLDELFEDPSSSGIIISEDPSATESNRALLYSGFMRTVCYTPSNTDGVEGAFNLTSEARLDGLVMVNVEPYYGSLILGGAGGSYKGNYSVNLMMTAYSLQPLPAWTDDDNPIAKLIPPTTLPLIAARKGDNYILCLADTQNTYIYREGDDTTLDTVEELCKHLGYEDNSILEIKGQISEDSNEYSEVISTLKLINESKATTIIQYNPQTRKGAGLATIYSGVAKLAEDNIKAEKRWLEWKWSASYDIAGPSKIIVDITITECKEDVDVKLYYYRGYTLIDFDVDSINCEGGRGHISLLKDLEEDSYTLKIRLESDEYFEGRLEISKKDVYVNAYCPNVWFSSGYVVGSGCVAAVQYSGEYYFAVVDRVVVEGVEGRPGVAEGTVVFHGVSGVYGLSSGGESVGYEFPFKVKVLEGETSGGLLAVYVNASRSYPYGVVNGTDGFGIYYYVDTEMYDYVDGEQVRKTVHAGFVLLSVADPLVKVYEFEPGITGGLDAYSVIADVDHNGLPELVFQTESLHYGRYNSKDDVYGGWGCQDWSVGRLYFKFADVAVDGERVAEVVVQFRYYFHDNAGDDTYDVDNPSHGIFGFYLVDENGAIVSSKEYIYQQLDDIEDTWPPNTNYVSDAAYVPVPGKAGTYYVVLGLSDPYGAGEINDADFTLAIEWVGIWYLFRTG